MKQRGTKNIPHVFPDEDSFDTLEDALDFGVICPESSGMSALFGKGMFLFDVGRHFQYTRDPLSVIWHDSFPFFSEGLGRFFEIP